MHNRYSYNLHIMIYNNTLIFILLYIINIYIYIYKLIFIHNLLLVIYIFQCIIYIIITLCNFNYEKYLIECYV